MVDRVFDFATVPCQILFNDNNGFPVRARLKQVSKGKAVVNSKELLKTGSALDVTLDFTQGPQFELQATVMSCGDGGLYLKWVFQDEKLQGRLQVALIEYSDKGAEDFPEPTISEEASEQVSSGFRDSLNKKARRVNSKRLARQHANVRVIGMNTVAELIKEAVTEAVGRSEHLWEKDARDRLLQEAQGVFQERLDSLRAEPSDAEQQREKVQKELEQACALLEEERSRILSADQFTVSDRSINQIEDRMERILNHVLSSGGAVNATTEQELREVVTTILDEERKALLDKAQSAQSETIHMLEHKISRMASALQSTEKERDKANRTAAALAAGGNGAVAGQAIFGGLDADEEESGQKLSLLKDLVMENREVRSHMGLPTADEPISPAENSAVGTISLEPSSKTESGGHHAHSTKKTISTPSPTSGDASPVTSNGVKKIIVKQFAPPPLNRS